MNMRVKSEERKRNGRIGRRQSDRRKRRWRDKRKGEKDEEEMGIERKEGIKAR